MFVRLDLVRNKEFDEQVVVTGQIGLDPFSAGRVEMQLFRLHRPKRPQIRREQPGGAGGRSVGMAQPVGPRLQPIQVTGTGQHEAFALLDNLLGRLMHADFQSARAVGSGCVREVMAQDVSFSGNQRRLAVGTMAAAPQALRDQTEAIAF